MLRFYFAFLVVVGLLSSMLTTCGSRSGEQKAASGAGQTILVNAAGNSGAAASEGLQQASSNGLTLQRQPDGHFYADAELNGTAVHMLVDTGATVIALSRDDARRAGIGISIGMPNVVGQGASGEVKGEYVTINRVSLGGESAENVPAIVLDGGNKSLLGQTFLAKFDSVEIHGDTMLLR